MKGIKQDRQTGKKEKRENRKRKENQDIQGEKKENMKEKMGGKEIVVKKELNKKWNNRK